MYWINFTVLKVVKLQDLHFIIHFRDSVFLKLLQKLFSLVFFILESYTAVHWVKGTQMKILVCEDWFISILLSRSTDEFPGFPYLVKLVIWSLSTLGTIFLQMTNRNSWILSKKCIPFFVLTLRKLRKSIMLFLPESEEIFLDCLAKAIGLTPKSIL